jgi:hypothetical protein
LAKSRSLLDDLIDAGKDVLKKLDDLFNPDRQQRQPVRVPVPVRNSDPRRTR